MYISSIKLIKVINFTVFIKEINNGGEGKMTGKIIITMLIAIVVSLLIDKFFVEKDKKIKEYLKLIKSSKVKIAEFIFITALLGIMTAIMDITVNTIFLELLIIVLFRIVVVDMKEKIIDMGLFIVLLVISVGSLFIDNGILLTNSLLTGILSFCMFFIVSKATRNAFGMGDAMILGAVGLIFGFQGLCGILIISSLLSCLVSVIYLIKGFKKNKNKEIAFTPFIFTAIVILILFNNI